ncbi:PilZ domain-containing protein [Sinorhizobium sp. BG8]|uniref:PilZ domain-containing protein n=1 Tax=Sinorhizobium sp. BG8 TaxID=2613773 RepID=UPI00193E90C3|nr:PilZ domain-containing protein [Sinorhizobium sp. BG8]QRM54484.1 PilZ domain-containing protein [Sinorhizobium sp. BG8]
MTTQNKQQTPFYRASTRSKVRIFGTLKVMAQTTRVRVVDLSAEGMALDLEHPLRLLSGQRVEVQTEELGKLEGTVRWYNNGRLGIQYKLNTNALAQVSSYFRFFHEEVTPVLRG